jgi:hypothetical protein
MSMTLRDEDRRALDLLLDRTSAAARANGNGHAAAGGVVFAAAQGGVSNERLHSAEKILRVLEALPAAEPPQDLVSRTLRRIEQTMAAGGEIEAAARRPLLIDAHRPMA